MPPDCIVHRLGADYVGRAMAGAQQSGRGGSKMEGSDLLEPCVISDYTFTPADWEATELSDGCWDTGQMPEEKKAEEKHSRQIY